MSVCRCVMDMMINIISRVTSFGQAKNHHLGTYLRNIWRVSIKGGSERMMQKFISTHFIPSWMCFMDVTGSIWDNPWTKEILSVIFLEIEIPPGERKRPKKWFFPKSIIDKQINYNVLAMHGHWTWITFPVKFAKKFPGVDKIDQSGGALPLFCNDGQH